MQQAWPFADLEWWIDAIHNFAGFPALSSNPPAIGGGIGEAYLRTLSETSAMEIRRISDDLTLSKTDKQERLFGAKALKKWRLPLSSLSARDREKEAMRGFLLRNTWAANARWDEGHMGHIVYLMRLLLGRWLPQVEPDGETLGRFGPGACGEHLNHLDRFIRLGEWVATAEHWPDVPIGCSDMDHVACRLCAVPKDWDKDRLITVEPAYSTFAQQYVRQLLLKSIHCGPLRGTCMDLGYTDGQAIQRRLALLASKNRLNATIDLKDASDRITWDIVQRTFPGWVVQLLEVSRSTQLLTPDGAVAELAIFAGMGNATTFVIETLFFSAWCRAIALHEGISSIVSVFGDDIICSSQLASALVRSTEVFPYAKINESKSFIGGTYLRESCGIFAHSGDDITVPRVDGYPPSFEGRMGLADLHGRLLRAGGRFTLLAHRIAREHLLPNWPFRVEGFPSISDWSVPFDVLPTTRWNIDLQAREAQLLVAEQRTRYVPTCSGPRRQVLGLYAGVLAGLIHSSGQRRPTIPFAVPKASRMRKRWLRITER